MSDQGPLIVLLDTLPFRRAAYASQLSTWAAPNGFVVQECTELKKDACAPALTLIVLGSQRIGSVEGRERIDAAMRMSNKPVAVIVDTQSADCINVALDLGLHGVLNVSETPEVLSAALGFIIAGGRYVPHVRASHAAPSEMSYLPQPADTSLTPIQVLGVEKPDNPDLTRRQYEVLYGLANGHSNKEIARDLELSEATVKSHVRQVMRKLHVDNRTQAALLARDLLSAPNAQNFYMQTPLT